MIVDAENKISFEYQIADILKGVHRTTSTMASTLITKEGVDLSEEFIFQKSQTELFEQFLKDSVAMLQLVFVNLTGNLSNAVSITNEKVTISIVKTESYDANILNQIDATLGESIIYSIVNYWFSTKNNELLMRVATNNITISNTLLNKYVSMIKRVKMRSFMGSYWN